MSVIAPRQQGPPLFGRRWQVTLAPNVHEKVVLQYGNVVADSTPLRVTFDIKKDCTGKPNPAHIVIYNMSAANRALVEDGWAIQVQAGYKDTVQTIWVGQVGKGIASRNPDLSTSEKASTKKEGTDVSFAIESAEGLGPMRYAKIHKSYAARVEASDVFRDIMQVMMDQTPTTGFGVTRGSIPNPFPINLLDKKLVLACSCDEALDKLLKPYGYEWFVHNNELSICALNDHTNDGIPYLSAENGLLGIPSRENEKSVSVKCLLTPQLAPGRLLYLDSIDKSFRGYFKCRSVQHKGDSHGDEFSSQVQCVPYDNPNLPIPVAPITG